MAIRTSRADHAPAAAADSALTAGRPSSYLTVMNALGVVPCVKHVPRNDVTRSPVPLATRGGLAGLRPWCGTSVEWCLFGPVVASLLQTERARFSTTLLMSRVELRLCSPGVVRLSSRRFLEQDRRVRLRLGGVVAQSVSLAAGMLSRLGGESPRPLRSNRPWAWAAVSSMSSRVQLK